MITTVGMPSDELQIIQLQNSYGVAIDTLNFDWFRELFTANVVADYTNPGSPTKVWTDLESWAGDFEPLHIELFLATQHMMVNHLVRVEGDTARAFCYGHVRLIRRDDPDHVITVVGYYDDLVVRTDSGWLIAERRWRRTVQSLDATSGIPRSLATEFRDEAVGFLAGRPSRSTARG